MLLNLIESKRFLFHFIAHVISHAHKKQKRVCLYLYMLYNSYTTMFCICMHVCVSFIGTIISIIHSKKDKMSHISMVNSDIPYIIHITHT